MHIVLASLHGEGSPIEARQPLYVAFEQHRSPAVLSPRFCAGITASLLLYLFSYTTALPYLLRL